MLQVSVNCFHCHRSLEDDSFRIDNLPSVKTTVVCKAGKGFLHMSSTYGDFQTEASVPLEEGEVVELYCPHCGKSLVIDEDCKECDAPIARVDIDAGGVIHFCTKKGCTYHHIEFEDVTNDLRGFLAKYPAVLVPFPREDENQEIE